MRFIYMMVLLSYRVGIFLFFIGISSIGYCSYGKRSALYFIQNTGQLDEDIKFYEKQKKYMTFFTKKGIYLIRSQITTGKQETPVHQNSQSSIHTTQSSVIKLLPLNTSKNLEILAGDMMEGKINYLIGRDPKNWKTDIPAYKAVVYREAYKNVDIKFYGNNQQMEYDVIIKPGGDLSRVRFAYRGIKDLEITDEGNLKVILDEGNLIQKRPYIYQEINGERCEIQGGFTVYRSEQTAEGRGTEPEIRDVKSGMRNPECKTRNPEYFAYGFHIESYDKRYPLTIDPELVYSACFGGNSSDWGHGIAVDGSGNVYITGETRSHNFPVISAMHKKKAGNAESSDIFITKLNASGDMVYSTYLGGNGDDISNGIAVDSSGNIYVTGYTKSSDFPIHSALYKNKNGKSDAFISKLQASGNTLIYSTYLGGSNSDWGRGIATDNSGNAYITGWTYSHDFPTVAAVFGNKSGGYQDAFVTKIASSGEKLLYSVYLGGSGHDSGNGIAVDNEGNACITGYTNSNDFPAVSASYEKYAGGYHDAFVAKLTASGSGLAFSTYLGGSEDDTGYGIAADAFGNTYVTGLTWSNNFPTVSPVLKNNAGNNDIFVTKLNTAGSVVYATYAGGSAYDGGYGITVDTLGYAYITGVTHSDDFPVTSPFLGAYAGDGDAFVMKLSPQGRKLIYSAYLGGSRNDTGYDIAVDTAGNAYITGKTWSNNFPVSSDIFKNNAEDYDVFITKVIVMKMEEKE
ncbi:MAG: hypothetical protein E3K32_05750 [wastewater metagenome]|nr:hypothetical protein [Candidatus Loosdrechtia aerotolerans]